MKFQEYVDLKSYTTFRMGGKARYFVGVSEIKDIVEVYNFAAEQNLPVFVLGGGSNILLTESDVFDAVVLKMEIKEFKVLSDSLENVRIQIGAGEIWDSVVSRAVENGWSGIEALSWIPGTAGATPIQNVGAYGAEISNVLESVEVYNIASKKLEKLSNKQCLFKYRDSIFKNAAKNKYLITSVVLNLSKNEPVVPDYPGVKKYFEEHNITNPNLTQIRKAIIDIRNLKLPDPKQVASVGSFFKNPIVDAKTYKSIQEKYEKVVSFPLENNRYKIGAGWMLETLGLKGQQFGNLQFYKNNALVLTNVDDASYDELNLLVIKTNLQVKETFGIDLEVEPLFISTTTL